MRLRHTRVRAILRMRSLSPMVERLEFRQVLSTTSKIAMVAHPMFELGRLVSNTTPPSSAFTPAQIQQAYGFNQIRFGSVRGDGAGQTIAIIDAYDTPAIQSDLNIFSSQFGLPSIMVSRVDQNGGTNYPAVDSSGGWALETTLDVEWAHAIAPAAQILLVEAGSPYDGDLLAAVNYGASQASVVSMSWGGGEFRGENTYDSNFARAGVAFVASSGDSGAPASWPAVSPNVVAVGGTALMLGANAVYASESGWSGSGGGPSAYESQPSYQSGVVTQTTSRANPDVAYDASPSTGFAVYDSVPYNGTSYGWLQIGGTSAGAPQWAALIAIADQGRALSGRPAINSANPQEVLTTLYQNANTAAFHDVTSGISTGTPNYAAGPGYDLVTGLGTPYTNVVVPMLVGAPSTSVLFSDGFGSSSLGPAWSTVNGSWSQSSGILRQTDLNGGDPKKASVTGVSFPTDVEVTARVRVDSWSGGDAARAGVSLGSDGSGNGYNLLFHNDTNTVEFLNDKVAWGNRYAFAWQVGTWYDFKLREQGGVLYGKIWADGQAEPSGWMFRQDGWGSRSGAPGVNGGSDAGATASFDDFAVNSVSTVGIPSVPTGLAARANSTTQITLTWTGSAGADSYAIERSPNGASGWSQVGAASAGATTWQDTSVAASTTYYYRVSAVNASGSSSPSNTATATTPTTSVLFSDGFGSSSLGPAWSTVNGSWSQSSGILRQTDLNGGDPKKASVTGVSFPTDVEVTARVRVDTWADGPWARAGVSLGNDGSGNGYNLLFHNDTNTVEFLNDKVAWGNRYAFAWQVGTWYDFKLREQGGVLYGKIWADGQAEPSGWMFRQDGWGSRSGAPGVNGGSDAGATASFDDFAVTSAS